MLSYKNIFLSIANVLNVMFWIKQKMPQTQMQEKTLFLYRKYLRNFMNLLF